MSHELTISVKPTDDTSLRPQEVRVNIPHDLIEMARTYPAIDWNIVMRRAVNGTTPPEPPK